MKTKQTIITVLLTMVLCIGFAQDVEQEILEERLFQLSFIPAMGTNKTPAAQVTNNISLNIIAGYNYGVKGVELGGFFNIDKKDVLGAQLGGFGNIVGGEVNGLQAAGFFNYSQKKVTGIQYAGFTNILLDDLKGAQGAGFVNISKNANALQGAGFTNIAIGNLTGAQGSGFVNVVIGKVTGVQGSGFANVATSEVTGVQASGFVNVATGNVKGVQGSGFANVAKDVTGAQLSGFVNYADNVKGVQLSFINIADTVEKGVVIGFLNIVKKGMHKFEVSHNDVTDINVSFKGGTHRLYSIIDGGISTDNIWSFGAGLGSQFNFKKGIYSNIEATSSALHLKKFDEHNFNNLNKININVGYYITPGLSVNAGPVLNIYISDKNDAIDRIYNKIGKKPFSDKTVDGNRVKVWMGYRVAFRF